MGILFDYKVDENNQETHCSRLKCRSCNGEYPVETGIPNFFKHTAGPSHSKRYEVMDSLYLKFYTPVTNLLFLACGGVENARNEVLDRLDIPDHACILETGIGTGDNLPFLMKKNGNSCFYGIDINQNLLERCASNCRKRKISVELFRCDAHLLPFKDHVFDTVFHLGAMNNFFDKKKAIQEMIRVAKPGTKIVIADESEKGARFFRLFTGQNEKVIPPVDLVPPSMLDLRLFNIWNGYGYLFEFRKPL